MWCSLTLPTRKIKYFSRRGSTEVHYIMKNFITMWCSLTLPTRKIKYLSRRGSTGSALHSKNIVGMWRSLVAHFAWDEGVARSNRVIPTILKEPLGALFCLSGYAILTCSHVLRNYSAGRKSVVITSRKTILNRFARQSTLRVSLHFFLKYFYNP